MPCGQLGEPTTVPAPPAEKPSQGAPGCFPGSPGEGQEELQQPGRQSAGACGHAAPAGPCSPGGSAPGHAPLTIFAWYRDCHCRDYLGEGCIGARVTQKDSTHRANSYTKKLGSWMASSRACSIWVSRSTMSRREGR